jgi:hypothetical protein
LDTASATAFINPGETVEISVTMNSAQPSGTDLWFKAATRPVLSTAWAGTTLQFSVDEVISQPRSDGRAIEKPPEAQIQEFAEQIFVFVYSILPILFGLIIILIITYLMMELRSPGKHAAKRKNFSKYRR